MSHDFRCAQCIRRCLYEKILIEVSQVCQGHITILIHEQFCPGQVVFIQGSCIQVIQVIQVVQVPNEREYRRIKSYEVVTHLQHVLDSYAPRSTLELSSAVSSSTTEMKEPTMAYDFESSYGNWLPNVDD